MFVCGSCLAAPLLFVRRVQPGFCCLFLGAADSTSFYRPPAGLCAWKRSGGQDSTIHIPLRVILFLSKRLSLQRRVMRACPRGICQPVNLPNPCCGWGLATAAPGDPYGQALLLTLFKIFLQASAFTEPRLFHLSIALAHNLPPML